MRGGIRNGRNNRAQRGVALLIMLVVLVLGALYFVVSQSNAASLKNARDKVTEDALAQAKDALIAYAVTYAENHPATDEVPGFLPCPEDSNTAKVEGQEASGCGAKNVSQIGRLPWKSLGLPPLRDASGNCLWYVVSGTFKNGNPTTKTDLMNWDTPGQLDIQDASGNYVAGPGFDTTVAAVVIAPGLPTGGKTQPQDASGSDVCGGDRDASNYLEGANATPSGYAYDAGQLLANEITTLRSDGSVISVGSSSVTVNDRLIAITPKEIFDAIQRRNDFISKVQTLTLDVARCIAWYPTQNAPSVGNALPWPAPIDGTDFTKNSSYADNIKQNVQGRVPYFVPKSIHDTSNNIPPATPLLSLSLASCPTWNSTDEVWYKNWKDQLFYAVAEAYSPDEKPPGSCSASNCIHVSSSATDNAAVVIFSGSRRPLQTRLSITDKGAPINYLEDLNLFDFQTPSNTNYIQGNFGTNINDYLVCIRAPSLNVQPCP
jgi:type II secretory pathway pseudopilin PulG